MKKVWPGHSLEGRSSIKRTAFQGERERNQTLLQGPAPPTAPLRRATEVVEVCGMLPWETNRHRPLCHS